MEGDLEGEMDQSFIKLLAGHVIGPLVNEYESHVKTLTRDVNMLKIALKSQRDIQRDLMDENKQLIMNLDVKQREYLKLVEETRDNVEILDQIRDGSLGGNKNDDDQENSLKERIHLLTEENHILFQQVTLLRAHHDQFSKECADKISEA